MEPIIAVLAHPPTALPLTGRSPNAVGGCAHARKDPTTDVQQTHHGCAGRPARQTISAVPTLSWIDYEPIDRVKAHFIFQADGVPRDMLWFQVTDDGSIVMSPRYKPALPWARIGKAIRHGSELRIPFDGARIVPQQLHDRKVTHHASGLIRVYGERIWSHSFRTLTSQTKIGTFVLAHPFRFGPTGKAKKQTGYLEVPGREVPAATPFGDVAVVDNVLQIGPRVETFKLSPTMPLFAAVYVCPLAKAAPRSPVPAGVDEPDMSDHMTILRFPFSDLSDCQDLMFSFVFGYGRQAAWPPVSIYAFERVPSGDDEDAG
jgi:hypothetical protein